MKEYFAVEMNSGAVNGFYSIKKDCIETTNYLAKRYVGSRWLFSEGSKIIGHHEKLYRSQFHSQDKRMRELLTSMFGDIENP
jgi:hypothetical protein